VPTPTSNRGWYEGWFYIQNPTKGHHPTFTGAVPQEEEVLGMEVPTQLPVGGDAVIDVISDCVQHGLTGARLLQMSVER